MSEEHKAILAGYQRALLSISKVAKDADNPYFNSKYIPLDSIQMAVKEALLAEGLAFSQNVDYHHEAQAVAVETLLISADGSIYSIGITRLPVPKLSPQDAGSAFTYARRYALAALFAIVADTDDDGEGAMKPHRVTPPKQAEPAPKSDAVPNNFENPLKADSFVFEGKKRVWAKLSDEALHAIAKGIERASKLPEAIRTRAQNELDRRNIANAIEAGAPTQ